MIPSSRFLQFIGCLTLAAALTAPRVSAQPPKPQPDVLILSDDERLAGHFVRSNGTSLIFKSDMLGELTIDWSKVKELHAAGQYVVVGKDTQLGPHADLSKIPQGKVDVAGKSVTVTPAAGAPPATVALSDANHIIAETDFHDKVMREPGFLHAWNGAIAAGASIVQATQQSRTFTGGIHLVRSIPTESWMASRNRTTINLSGSDGFQSQPGTPKIKTAIVHGDIERDQYFSTSRMFGFAQAMFDHNISQGLDLQQQYGGGLGWTAVKNASNVLDLKGSVEFMKQQFQQSNQDQSLVASSFSEAYTHRFKRGITFLQGFSATPTWNNTSAWLAGANATITVPVFKRLNFNTSLIDNYLHRPSPGFKKNSFQLTTGLTYTLR